jgi:hypothetical protein
MASLQQAVLRNYDCQRLRLFHPQLRKAAEALPAMGGRQHSETMLENTDKEGVNNKSNN